MYSASHACSKKLCVLLKSVHFSKDINVDPSLPERPETLAMSLRPAPYFRGYEIYTSP